MSSPSRSLILSLILVATITSFLSFHLYGFKETFANGAPVNNSNFSTFAPQNTNPTLESTITTDNSTFAAPQQATGPSTFAPQNTNPTLETTTTTPNSTSTSHRASAGNRSLRPTTRTSCKSGSSRYN